MISRMLWNIAVLVLIFMAPWWATFVICLIGAIIFPWYIEMVIAGMVYDALYGGVAIAWYRHLWHTLLFGGTMTIISFIKQRINL